MRTEGGSAVITRNNSETAAREGQSLSDGNAAATGFASHIYLNLNLNSRSVLKMDETSKIEVNRVSARGLSITLVEGAIAADITREGDDDLYEIRVGRSALSVRGTSFIVEYREASPVIVMLTGNGDVDGVLLTEGNVAVIEDGAVTVVPLVITDSFSPFIRNEISNRVDSQLYLPQETVSEPQPDFVTGYTTATHLRGRINETFSFDIIGASGGSVWGSDIYTDDSVIARAAVHAGLVAVGEAATVIIRILPGFDSYPSTDRNGVTTSRWDSWGGSFEFVYGAGMTPSASGLLQGEHIWEADPLFRYMFYLIDGIPQPMGTVYVDRGGPQEAPPPAGENPQTAGDMFQTTVMAYMSDRESVNHAWSDWEPAPHYWAGLRCTHCGDETPDGDMPEWFRYSFTHAWSGEWKNAPLIFDESFE
jgi:hypothetical protein